MSLKARPTRATFTCHMTWRRGLGNRMCMSYRHLQTKLSSTGHVGGSVLEALCPSETCFQLGLAIGSSLRSLARQGDI